MMIYIMKTVAKCVRFTLYTNSSLKFEQRLFFRREYIVCVGITDFGVRVYVWDPSQWLKILDCRSHESRSHFRKSIWKDINAWIHNDLLENS